MEIYYKILTFDKIIAWFLKHPNYRLEFEAIMRIHNDNPEFNLGTLIYDNLKSKYKVGLNGKIILLIDKPTSTIAGSAISELETSGNNYISNVFVKETYRGKGLCKKLIESLVNSYDKGGFLLDVNKNNVAAIKCYTSAGFKIGEEKSYYKDGVKNFYYVMIR